MRIRINITGLVQGVGFRPFIHRLANETGLKGYVQNNPSGLLIEAEGEEDKLENFLVRIESEKPSISRIFSLQYAFLEETGYKEFKIIESKDGGQKKASILPDIATCGKCTEEIFNPKDRRFIYPFTNCTECGPRFTIIENLPYDRKNTSMKAFQMCADCKAEYGLETDRRFHAQPNACHKCGPWLSLHDSNGKLLKTKDDAIEETVNQLRKGSIIALKGIGGYHLLCDATNEDTVLRLRRRKFREERPMAVIFPDLDSIKTETDLNILEERAVNSIERPIVIVSKKESTSIAGSVSPDNSTLGVFLPYTPIHHTIMKKLKKPLVATSANTTDEPIAKDEEDAFSRLSAIADYILSHNREITRRCDDSVVRIMAGRQVPLRRSRGFAPLPFTIPFSFKRPALALGAYMNNTIALGIENMVYLSQHIGDLDTPLTIEFYEETVNDFLRLFDLKPEVVVSDMHPGYYSTRFGERDFSDKLLKVQHHYAHILSCMIENELPEDAEVIGFAFDGTGYGSDRTIWGGEVMTASYRGFKRVCHLRPFRLPGGERAVREPYRTALSILYETFGDDSAYYGLSPATEEERSFLLNMIRNDVNSPVTTSMGRLFDGVASLIGHKHKVSYHAQAAIGLEQLAAGSSETGSYPFALDDNMIDYRPVIQEIVEDLRRERSKPDIARKFHNTISDMVLAVTESLKKESGLNRVALSGGVFQNRILLEDIFSRLRQRGFIPLVHQLVPSNDGGIALGQAVAALFHDRYNNQV